MTERDDILTPQELADRLGVKKSTIYHWSHTNFIPTVKLGNLIRFRWSSIVKWLDKKEKAGRSSIRFNIDDLLS